MSPSIVWFRLDLRLADQPALQAAIQRGGPVIPLYIWAPEEEADWSPGACSRWWLHHSLRRLQARLNEIGGRLIIRRGPSEDALRQLIRETGAEAVFWNRRYEPAIIERDRRNCNRTASQCKASTHRYCWNRGRYKPGRGSRIRCLLRSGSQPGSNCERFRFFPSRSRWAVSPKMWNR